MPGIRAATTIIVMLLVASPLTVDAASPLPSPSTSPAVRATSGPVLPPPSEVLLPAAPQPKGRPDASTTRHGVRVELWLSSSTVTPGEWVQAVVRTTNLRETPAFAMSGDCHRSGTAVDVQLDPEVPSDQAFTGNAGAFKRRVLRDSLLTHAYLDQRKGVLRWVTDSATGGPALAFVECPYPPPGPRRLGPGASVIERFAWYPVGSFDNDPWLHPMWPGAGTVTVSWPYLSRVAPPVASVRQMYRMVRPIRASAAIEVASEGPNARGLPELVDLALADPRFRAWVEADPTRRSWRGTSAFAESGPTFEPSLYLWNLHDPPSTGVVFVGLERAIDGQSHRGIVTLDPWTGEVLQVECVGPSQDRPCPQPGPLAWSDDELASAGDPTGPEAGLLPAVIGAVTSLPALLWPDAPVPDSLAVFVPPPARAFGTTPAMGFASRSICASSRPAAAAMAASRSSSRSCCCHGRRPPTPTPSAAACRPRPTMAGVVATASARSSMTPSSSTSWAEASGESARTRSRK